MIWWAILVVAYFCYFISPWLTIAIASAGLIAVIITATIEDKRHKEWRAKHFKELEKIMNDSA